MNHDFLPYGRQSIDDDDVAAVAAALRSDYLTTGPRVGAFEEAFAAYVDAADAAVCDTGTAALHLAMIALDVGAGDRVIAPSMSFLASANGARFTGAEVVFADCDPDTGLMTPQTVEDAFARAGGPVKAVVIVHLNGQPADVEGILAVCRRHGAALVEDACHALGSVYRDEAGAAHTVGACAHSDLACFSLHPVKTITMGEGGVVTGRDRDLIARVRLARAHGMIRDPAAFARPARGLGGDGEANPWYYEMQDLGYNYRASDLACALGLSQLSKMPAFAGRRRAIAALYDRAFAGFPAWARPVAMRQGVSPVLHLYVLLTEFERTPGGSRAAVMAALRQRGIGTQVHYVPIHQQPYYEDRYGAQTLEGAERYYARALSIPHFPAMTDADAGRVVEALVEVLGIGRGS